MGFPWSRRGMSTVRATAQTSPRLYGRHTSIPLTGEVCIHRGVLVRQVRSPKEANVITGHTTRLSNLFVWAVVLVLAVFAATALIAFDQSGWRAKPQAEQPLTVANPFPYHRLHELTAYKHSEWGLELAN